MKKQKISFFNIGFSSILLIFILICLVTFAALSVLTAHSDYRLSEKTAEKTTAYYDADSVARSTASAIENMLFSIYQGASDASDYYEKIIAYDFSDGLPEQTSAVRLLTDEEGTMISYEVKVSEVQTLFVTLKLHYPQSDSEYFFHIVRWQTKTTNEPEESDDRLPLFTGN